MQTGNVEARDNTSEVWCDKCAKDGQRKGSFIVTGNASAQPCQRPGCDDPQAEMKARKK
ncbi:MULTISPECIES: hypothetical protein [Pseudomonas syringae group]|uniref:Uncharacterized protein n=1 Tax=Pseudomonas serbiensis TaxID=3064350 RepID=A0ABT9CYW0_9PSED|nr:MULTISPECIES: hypothetical protein [Pseudomonas]MBX8489548.1 hypothetical protein [Pseudomonas cichorii]MBX8517782.1 hypothetical protein [Pseudomonas cichorii]MBX8541537.1 hypothetical protein [Pseudomonas cichorii]MBX8556071.1 hypothetical protein [Pseudomonas cichorii]MBX8566533.1 hypothetical protein [Pseudomonas cichorii]